MAHLAQFHKLLRQAKIVGVDSNVFIYQFEEHPQFQPFTTVLFDSLSNTEIQVVTSMVTVSELLVRPFAKQAVDVIQLYEGVFLSLPNFSLIQIDYRVAKAAAQLRAEYNILLPDAIQIAAAIIGRAHLFVTNDRQLKKVTDIQVVCLKDFC